MDFILVDGKPCRIDTKKAKELGVLIPSYPTGWKEYCNSFDTPEKHRWYEIQNNSEKNALIALGQLVQLRAAWINAWEPGWKPNWKTSEEEKYCIINCRNQLILDTSCTVCHILSFPKQEMCEEFFSTFKDLLEQAKMFL